MKKQSSSRIAENKKAFYEYTIEDQFEAGIILEGWELKSIRMGRIQITEAHVVIRNEEVYLIGCQMTPLHTSRSPTVLDPTRTRKLLLHKDQIRRLNGKVSEKGYTIVPLNAHWANGRVKIEIGLAKGKAAHDKRASIKERESKLEVARAMKERR